MKNLVIVESPAKAKTIERYLGKDFKVEATLGHVRDLPKSEIGVDVEHDFEPKYVIMQGKTKVISTLKKAVKDSDKVYLALDLDREGEAIAWHIAQVLGLVDETGVPIKKKGVPETKRIVFNEITKSALEAAIEKPRDLDINLIDAQQARRVLDRIVGYTLSPLIWTKIRYGLSAGRVQSVAVRLIVDRERERDAFKPEEYWDVIAKLESEYGDKIDFALAKKKGKKYSPRNMDEADDVESAVKGEKWVISDVKQREVKKYPKPPFTTSTLQQAANNRFGFTAKRTMGIAQELYQGVKLGKKGQTALITYMRTDSISLSNQAIESIRKHISVDVGESYLPEKPILYKSRSKSAQEAHEAIRPTDVSLIPAVVKSSLKADAYKLYSLIWKRTVASQMKPAVYDRLTAEIEVGDYLFKSTAQAIKYDGFLKVWGIPKSQEESGEEANMNNISTPLDKGQALDLKKIEKVQHFTKPPARYTDASLVKELEKHGIGRPSTYAPTITTIQNRGYVSKDGRFFFPEDVGYVVNDFLVKHFPDIVDLDFTAEMEEDLDRIVDDNLEWVPMIAKFFGPFRDLIEKKKEEIKKEDVVVMGKSDEKCPECGKSMIIKLGKYGKFLSCSDFPDCKGMKSLDGEGEELDLKKYIKPDKCPECSSPMELKIGKYGKFWACTTYPKCKGIVPLLLSEMCPECDHHLVERKGRWGKSFTGCSNYPNCKYIKKVKKEEEE